MLHVQSDLQLHLLSFVPYLHVGQRSLTVVCMYDRIHISFLYITAFALSFQSCSSPN